MYQHASARRRKKRPVHGVKTVQVTRGRSGYGFTISGQNPCVLSCIISKSPADVAGLKAGDYLYVVNGVNVSNAPHDDVVRMVGQSTGMLELLVGENLNSSDSSEDDYLPRSKSRYPNRVRFRQPCVENLPPPGIASRPLPQRPDARKAHGKPRHHVPVGAESDFSTSATSPGSSQSDDRNRHSYNDHHDRANRKQHRKCEAIQLATHGRKYNGKYTESSGAGTDLSSEGFAFTTVQNGPVVSTAKISSALSKNHSSKSLEPQQRSDSVFSHLPQSSENCDEEERPVHQDVDDERNVEHVQEMIAEIDDDTDIAVIDSTVQAVVGYIGSIELPGNATRPHQSLQLLRSAVRRLRVEQKIHTLVLMEVSEDGVRLIGTSRNIIAHYSVEKLAFSGICPDDKRFFGIVTLHSSSDDVSEISSQLEDRSPGSSCHVFMVDPDLCSHVLHSHKAKSFGLECTPSPNGERCLEFPQTATQLILCIANLYRDRPRSKLDNEIIQSHAFADPSRPAERSSSSSSNSDSGLGFGREDGGNEQVCVVDMPISGSARAASCSDMHNLNRSLQSNNRPISPDVQTLSTPHGFHRPSSAFEIRRGLNNSSSSEECWGGPGKPNKLTPRAMPDPDPSQLPRSSSANILEYNSAESLRHSMQRLLQARQQRLQQDQLVSSDSESQISSRINADLFTARSAFQVPRPVSAPLKSRSWYSRGHDRVETVDMALGKLSPRAYLQPGKMTRSPSAPPIPYFPHQDTDEDDVDDTESEDDPFVRRIISQFSRERVLDFGEENPRRFSEGFALTKKREIERAELEESQLRTRSGSFRRPHSSRANISQSHESLMVGEGQVTSPHHKIITANSVNSILQATSIEEIGRVAGWAVSLQRLLTDSVGLSVFSEFLKKEYSQENIVFWSSCETFKQITDDNQVSR